MVEEDFRAPARLVMTAFALLPFLSLMNIILLMAGETRRSQLFLLWIWPHVAGSTGEFPVPLF
jgi:hypothetical protein